MLDAKMKLYQNPVRVTGMSDLEDKFNNWEQLGRELGAGGELFHVPDITKNIALAQLVPKGHREPVHSGAKTFASDS